MKVVITGGAGFLGCKLAARLLADGQLTGPSGQPEAIDRLVLFDQIEAPAELTANPRVAVMAGDITERATVDAALGGDADSIFHLASVVSGGAEEDFDLGYRVNMGGMSNVLEAARAQGNRPRLVFASSVAVYGGALPDPVTDDTPLTPQTSYGVHKATGELLVHDYSRKGFINGRAVRLPTVAIRPGKPNKAASGFASGIVREPLNGIDFACPVTPETPMAYISPRKVIDAFVRLHELDGSALGFSRTILLTGIKVSMAEVVASLRRVGGDAPAERVSFVGDPAIQAIVDLWPRATRGDRAAKLGFEADASMDDIIRAYIEDELQ